MLKSGRVRSLLLSLALALPAAARDPGFGVDAVLIGLFPTNRYKSEVSPALGGLAGFELALFPPLSLTARTGYIAHFERKNAWRSLVPAFAGAKLVSYSTSLYLAGEMGPVLTREHYVGSDPARGDRRRTPMAWGAGLGSAIDEKDLRFSLHIWDSERPRETLTFGISLAILYLD